MRGPKAMVPRWAWLGLVIILAFDVWWRGHTFGPLVRDRMGLDLWPVSGAEGEPLDCDESAYAYIGRRIVRGDVLYRDLTENKPPLGYWLYALAVAIGGADEMTIRVMPIPMVLVTIVLIWSIALRLTGPATALLAAAIYSIVSTDPYLFGNGANLEHAINLFSVASLALMIHALSRPRFGLFAAAGAFLGAACLVKQVAMTHLLVFGIAILARKSSSVAGMPPHPDPHMEERRSGGHGIAGRSLKASEGRLVSSRWAGLLALFGGFTLAWGIAILVLIRQGAGPEAFEDIVRYGGALATDTPADPNAPPFFLRWFAGNADPKGELPPPFGRTDYLVFWGAGTWPLWLATPAAIAWLSFGPRSNGPRRLVAGWTISVWFQVALLCLFWPHYYLLPLPGVALSVAVLMGDLVRCVRRTKPGSEVSGTRVSCGIGALTFALAMGWTTWVQVRDYLLVPPPELTVRYKGGHQWVALRQLGRTLARGSKVWEAPHLFVWGIQSPLFVYSGLDGVTPHFFADPLLKAYANRNHPLIRPRIARIMGDLRERRPELIFAGDPPFPALRAFLEKHYARWGYPLPEGRGLWVERRSIGRFEGALRAPPGRVPPYPAGSDSTIRK